MDKTNLNLLEVNYLSKTINDKICLENVSFSLRNGEILGYLGPNGAGKTTTIRLILGLLNPSKGSIVINGGIGVLMDFDCLYRELTAKENLEYFDMIKNSKIGRKERITYWLKKVGLLNEKDKKIKKFSKGMKKRLALACILIQEPEILILDEPFSGLDIEWKKKFCAIISDYSKNSGILIASHDILEMQKICTKYVLINGKVIFTLDNRVDSISKLEQIYMEGFA